MTKEKQREQVIQIIADQLRSLPFSVEFKVVKNPKGIKVIREVTKEQMDMMIENARKEREELALGEKKTS